MPVLLEASLISGGNDADQCVYLKQDVEECNSDTCYKECADTSNLYDRHEEI